MGLPDLRGSSSGDHLHQFCPSTNGTAEVDTCQSSFDTMLFIKGPDVNLDCDDACEGFDGCPGNREKVNFDFKAGKCYDIIVSGYASMEGNYVLSIDCGGVPAIEVECGSNVSSSTIGLGGAQPHLFCPNETGRVEVSTCGSDFNTEIQLSGLNGSGFIPDFECDACPADLNAECVGFNARCVFCSAGCAGLGFALLLVCFSGCNNGM